MEIGTQSLRLTIDVRCLSAAIFPKALQTYARMDSNMASPRRQHNLQRKLMNNKGWAYYEAITQSPHVWACVLGQ